MLPNLPSRTLHIVNGDALAQQLKTHGLSGEFFPWRELLHEGPVPFSGEVRELASARGSFLDRQVGGAFGDGEQTVTANFNQLLAADAFEAVRFWFEPDLFDQLQLLQILSFAQQQEALAKVLIQKARVIVAHDMYPNLDAFALMQLAESAVPVDVEMLDTANVAWYAYTSPSPQDWPTLATIELPEALRFVPSAFHRLLEELPSAHNGLPRTLHQALRILAGESEPIPPTQLFREVNLKEEWPYLGDWPFWQKLRELLLASKPLVAVEPSEEEVPSADAFAKAGFKLRITAEGQAVFSGEADAIRDSQMPLNRWLGGVHLTSESHWRWCVERKELISPEDWEVDDPVEAGAEEAE